MRRLSCFFVLLLAYGCQCQTLSKDDEVIVFPSYAYEHEGVVQVNVHAWIFEPEPNSVWRQTLVQSLKPFFPERQTEAQDRTLARRLHGFMPDNEGRKVLALRLGNQSLKSNPSGSDGHSETTLDLKLSPTEKADLAAGRLSITWDSGGEQKPIWIGKEGLSVVSDIDDTIKISQVLIQKALIVNSFLKDFEPTSGMPEFYRKLAARGAVFHYVSASPWQLFPDIQMFLQQYFPRGTVSLRKLRLKDSSGVDFLWGDTAAYKIETISSLIQKFPQRKFLLIGDSGEKDPEVYAEIRLRFPQQIVGVLIRIPPEQKDVTQMPGMEYFREPTELREYQL